MDGKTQIYSIFWLGTVTMLMLVLCLILLAIFYQNNINKMKVREGAEVLRARLEGETKERKRIAADLHDGVSNDLTAIKAFLLTLVKTEDFERRLEIYKELKNGIENVVENTRRISYTLMPPLIESQGLAAAISDNFERLTKSTGRNFTLSSTSNPDVGASIAYEIFRVVQEFATNILKHSDARFCKLEIFETASEYKIEIVDDGTPYSFEELLVVSNGAGLKNIHSRLKAIGADFHQIAEQAGNRFLISMPKE